MKTMIFTLMIVLWVGFSMIQAAPPGGGYNGWRQLGASVSVKGPGGNPMDGILVRFVADIEGTIEGDTRVLTGITNSSGYVIFSVTLEYTGWEVGHSIAVSLIAGDGYSVLSGQNTWTNVSYDLNSQFQVAIDEDGNGVHDAWEMQLARKFCPSLQLSHPTYWVAPEPVEYITLSKNDLWMSIFNMGDGRFVGDYTQDQITVSSWYNPKPSILTTNHYAGLECNAYRFVGRPYNWSFGPYFIVYHHNYAGNGNGPSAWKAFYQSEQMSNSHAHTVYAHLFKMDDNRVAIQYWFFYPYNDWANNHEGDWEHINVIADYCNPSASNLLQVDYYFHHKVRTVPASGCVIDNGTHPVVFVGGTASDLPIGISGGDVSGGSYPSTGLWSDVVYIPVLGSIDDNVLGQGPYISYSSFIDYNLQDGTGIVMLPNPQSIDYSARPELSWLKAHIRFGYIDASSPGDWTNGDVGQLAPYSPYYNDGWERTGPCGYYESY